MKTVRFYCVSGDVALAYLRALVTAEIPVRALALFGGPLMVAPDVASAFVGPVPVDFINVVCAPPGMFLGHELTEADLVPPRQAADNAWDVVRALRATDEVVYKPDTVFEALWTEGVPNVAIPTRAGTDPGLSRYDWMWDTDPGDICSRFDTIATSVG